jgi:AmmeMemoRadiSam system protein B
MLFVRPPVAAGRFYDIEPDRLRRQLEVAFKQADDGARARGVAKHAKIRGGVVPHAGYEYSGRVAAKFYSLLDGKSPRNCIILGPNHYSTGSKFAAMKDSLWKTPLGGVAMHEGMNEALLAGSGLLQTDVTPHQNDHSIEVQLPFLQSRFGEDFKFVPIAISNELGDPDVLPSCRMIGAAIADAVRKSKEGWLIIASSDFSHYVPQDVAEKTDGALIKAIVKMDEGAFFSRVNELNASMCGFGPVIATMVAAKKLGAKKGTLLKYATSGNVTDDYSSVVGYASIAF